MSSGRFLILPCMLVMIWMQACIHEYPVPVSNKGVGENPSVVEGYIELSYDLSWEKLIHRIEFSSKAGINNSHRFIIELCKEGVPVVHEETYISDSEFSAGRIRRKLNASLSPEKYEIAAWYDRRNEEGGTYFNANDLRAVKIKNTSTTDTLAFHCAYSKSTLDLREYAGGYKTESVVKEMEMILPAARFQIVATDVQQFISEQKDALNQGDKFTAQINFAGGGFNGFNTFTGNSFVGEEGYRLEGWMRLPFAEYDEITIAQGLVFCDLESDVGLSVGVINQALITVSKTDVFYFPVKRGYITVIKGDFLTHPIDGVFNINHIWAGEILYEI